MNLYEFEGKALFAKHGIAVPRGVLVRRGDDAGAAYETIAGGTVVVKVQILSGKRGKNGGIQFCKSADEVQAAVDAMFTQMINGQYVASVYVEEALAIAREHYLSITYDTNTKQPMLLYSATGGVDVEEAEGEMNRIALDIRHEELSDEACEQLRTAAGASDALVDVARKLWRCFLESDSRQVEINPLAELEGGALIAADAKVALDDDAFYRHDEWSAYEERTMMGRPPTAREVAVKAIDEGEGYYKGTAGKYIELDGTIAVLFSGGGASIANMDALEQVGLKAANYTEYSGNPPREKVAELAKIVLSKPGLEGLWIAGGVANFTNVRDTFLGIADALDEVKPKYPIVIRRAGPFEAEGMELMRACAERNGLDMTLFGKDVSMSATAAELAKRL